MKKQTAVEWLAEQITTIKWKMADVTDRNAIIDQAKAIEKEQSINIIAKYIDDNLDPSTHGNTENVKEWFETYKSK